MIYFNRASSSLANSNLSTLNPINVNLLKIIESMLASKFFFLNASVGGVATSGANCSPPCSGGKPTNALISFAVIDAITLLATNGLNELIASVTSAALSLVFLTTLFKPILNCPSIKFLISSRVKDAINIPSVISIPKPLSGSILKTGLNPHSFKTQFISFSYRC